MSIRQNTAAKPAAAKAAPTSAQKANADQGQPTTTRFLSLPVRGSAIQEESLRNCLEIAEAAVKTVNEQQGLELKVIPIDRKMANLPVSFVAICEERVNEHRKKVLVAGLMMVEETRKDVQPYQQVRLDGQTIEVPTVITDVISAPLNDAIMNFLQNRVQTAEEFFIAQTVLIPEISTKGGVNPLAVGSLSNCTIMAVIQAGDRHVNQLRYDAQTINNAFSRERGGLTVRYDASNSAYVDLAGIPTRNELAIELGRSSDYEMGYGGIERSVVVHSYVDMNFVGSAPDEFAREAKNDVYEPLLVISDISPDEMTGMSFATLFLAIYAGTLAIADQAWRRVFHPRFSAANNVVPRDVLDLVTMIYDPQTRSYRERLEVVDGQLNAEMVNRLLDRLIVGSPKLAIDVARASPASYLLAYLTAHCTANTMHEEKSELFDVGSLNDLHADFIREIHEFTNGHFPLEYKGNILHNEEYRLLLGEARVQVGSGKDVSVDPREFDHRAFLTRVGGTDRQLVEDFDLTTYHNSANPNIRKRVAEQDRLRKTIFTNDIHYSTSAARYVFDDAFLVEFIRACRDAGFVAKRMEDDNGRGGSYRRDPRSHTYDLSAIDFGERLRSVRGSERRTDIYTDRVNVGTRRTGD